MTKRRKKPSVKALENKIATRRNNIDVNISKFNRLIKKGAEITPEKLSALTDIYLDVTADLEILGELDPDFSVNAQTAEQVKLMEKYVKADSEKQSNHSGSIRSKTSRSSVAIEVAKIQAEEVEAEIQALRVQVENERVLKELEDKLRAQKLKMQEQSLIDKKKRLSLRKTLLEERDLDSREDIVEALDNVSVQNVQTHNKPQSQSARAINTNDSQSIDLTTKSDKSDTQALAQSIAQAMHSSRLPVPEPSVFSGNPLEYVDWEVSFRTLVERSGIPDSDKIHYLKRYVAGPAREAVSALFLLTSSNAYEKAKAKLKERFGSDFAVAEAFRSKLQQWPKIKSNENLHLQKFADFLSQCETAMTQLTGLEILNDSQQNIALMTKLPDWLANRWKRQIVHHKKTVGVFPTFSMFVEFVNDESDILNDPALVNYSACSEKSKATRKPEQPKSTTHLSNSSRSTKNKECCSFCLMSNHEVAECRKLANKTAEEKKQFVFEKRLCFACLKGSDHRSSACTNKATCKKCGKSHPTALHNEQQVAQSHSASKHKSSSNEANQVKAYQSNKVNKDTGASAPTSQVNTVDVTESKSLATCIDNQSSLRHSLSSMVIPVWLSSKKYPAHEVLVYALLDTMSDTTFVTNDAVAQLNAEGTAASMQLTTMTTNSKNIQCYAYKDLAIRGYNSHESIHVPCAYSRNSIPLDKGHIPTAARAKEWPHLLSIVREIPDLQKENVEVGMLIGYDTSRALVPLKSITGPNHTDPYAVQTPLGWSIVGETKKGNASAQCISHMITTLPNANHVEHEPQSVTFACEVTPEQVELASADIINLLQQDFADVNNVKGKHTSMSQDDKRFMEMLTTNIEQKSDGHYSMPLPFKARPAMPNNQSMALKRFAMLQKKFSKDSKYKTDYVSFMNTIIESGDAEPVPSDSEQKAGEVWYIPHFGVYHPKKPEKIRVVFDCSAKFQGTSLNDHLLQGPDQINSLVGVLHRFRKEKVAVMCDIQRMFHMFKVHDADRNYLRFLWFKDQTMTEIAEFRMAVHLFGATSSPGCATFGLRTLANEKHNKQDNYSKQARDLIEHNFYVDDGLFSVGSTEQAIGIVSSAVELCSKANLRLHKFVSNDKTVMQAIPESEKATNVKDLDLQSADKSLPVERALGVQWCLQSDCFKFRVTQNNQLLTRRAILSTIASVFDPLGFISPFILNGKQILQEMCKSGAGWDDPLPTHLHTKWQSWIQCLAELEMVQIPRCLTPPDFGTVVSTELHHFSDASTLGYGQCSYIRFTNDANEVHCTLLHGKSRVAPLKQVTIPRAELQAAVLSAKMAHSLKTELKLTNLTKEVFWTDSKVVLGYIQNEARRFHIYVANRVQQIRDLTAVEQWNYVGSNDNPADIASRGASVSKLVDSCWFTGPKFLWQNQMLSHPMRKVDNYVLKPDDPEVRAQCHLVDISKSNTMTDRLQAFSNLNTAVRAVCNLKQLAKSKHSADKVNVLSISQLERARLQIMKWAQQDAFDDYNDVANNKLAKGSCLTKLDPFIDETGLLRVGGRLQTSDLSFDERHPIILPKKSHVTKLVVDYYHKQIAHQGQGMTINAIRNAGYWIISCSSVVKQHIYNCVVCRRQRRPTEGQKMAELPPERTNATPPFTYVGSDCFGPFVVKDGRKEQKRYGVIFTCMASRAVHIETVDDMTTDAFINALRCFIAIRGPIRQLHIDRGTKFYWRSQRVCKSCIREQ